MQRVKGINKINKKEGDMRKKKESENDVKKQDYFFCHWVIQI